MFGLSICKCKPPSLKGLCDTFRLPQKRVAQKYHREAFPMPGALAHTRITWALSPTTPQVSSITLGSLLCLWCFRYSSWKAMRQFTYFKCVLSLALIPSWNAHNWFLTNDVSLLLFLPEFKTVRDDVRAYGVLYIFALAMDWWAINELPLCLPTDTKLIVHSYHKIFKYFFWICVYYIFCLIWWKITIL